MCGDPARAAVRAGSARLTHRRLHATRTRLSLAPSSSVLGDDAASGAGEVAFGLTAPAAVSWRRGEERSKMIRPFGPAGAFRLSAALLAVAPMVAVAAMRRHRAATAR